MLKIWKSTWKGTDDRDLRPKRDSEQDDMVGEHGGASPLIVGAATPPLDAILPSALPDGAKCTRKHIEIEDILNDEPRKKLRPNGSPVSGSLGLGNHLPEINDTDKVESLFPLSISVFREQVLEHAKRENTIAVLPPLRTAFTVVVQFLAWAIENERSRRGLMPTGTRLRTALFVLDSELSIEQYSAKIQAEMPQFRIGSHGENHPKDADPWHSLLQQDVVIIPSTLLLSSLLKGTAAITQFHVLIIDNAQNIQDQDSHALVPLVQVMNIFYRITDPLSRPRIFALATPPADRGFPFDSAMLRLEQTLDSKVVGVSEEKRKEILALPDRPNEVVVLYDTPVQPITTKLFKQLQQHDPSESVFRKQFRASRHVLAELGACASDLIWRRALKDMELTVSPWYEEDEEEGEGEEGSLPIANRRRKICDVVKNWPFTMPNLDPSSRGFNVTHKFLSLVKLLKACEPYGEGFRGIVFVRRSAIAFVIVELLRILDGQASFLRPYALVGHGDGLTPNHLQEVFRTFATGGYNLLIATQSAEDLEIPKASMVVRFDVIESSVSQAYVRACARGRESHLVHLAERGNDTHRWILSRTTELDANMLRWTESMCKMPHSSVPPSPLRECVVAYHSDDEDEDTIREYIRDPTTSSHIYPEDALTVVYRFASTLPRNGRGIKADETLFEFEDEQKESDMPRTYICTVLLPGTPVHQFSGPPSTSRAIARRAACYRVCEELAKMGLLDYRLFPLPSMSETKNETDIELSSDKAAGTRSYLRKQPDFWISAGSTSTTLLYPIVISDYVDKAMRPHSPFLLLTRQPLPDMPSLNLFFAGVLATVNFKRGAPFQVNDTYLTDLHLYTIRLVRLICNKPYTCSKADMLYFFAPLTVKWNSLGGNSFVLPNVADHIPWNLVSFAGDKFIVPLKGGTVEDMEQDIQDAVIQDRRLEFTRRYDAVRVRPDLTPLSKPADSPREAEYSSLFDFCKAHRTNFQGLQNYKQPIIEVSRIPNMLNRLNPTSRDLTTTAKTPAKYLIPELCAKCTIPATVYRSALLLPSITRRIDDFLLVKELNAKLFHHSISEDLLHIAICAPSAGYEYDYERLEMLGDGFLKYLSTVYVFVTCPSLGEGSMHTTRQQLISNKTLFQCATSVSLPAYIQSKPFAIRQWHPPNFESDQVNRESNNKPVDRPTLGQDVKDLQDIGSVKKPTTNAAQERSLSQAEAPTEATTARKPRRRKQRQSEDTQWLGDKAVADVAEAIIGAAYMTGGRETALKVTKALRIPILGIEQWSDFGRKVLAPPPKYTAKMRPGSIVAIQSIIGHKISRPHLLAQALTHSSTQGYESTSYERLEFIGDAILDFMVIRYIFDRDHQLSPGGLTLLKGAMVSNSVLAAICVWSGLHKHLHYESYVLANNIREYIKKLGAKQACEYEAAEKEGRAPGQYWLDIDPPKVLSDVVESVIGAIYISDNFMPVGVEALFDNVLKPFYDKHITLKTLSHHPTKVLFELFQAQGCQQFSIQKEKIENATRCHVIVHDIILASGEDQVPAVAARCASFFALDALEGDAAFFMRNCDCRTIAQSKKKHKQKALENVLLDFEEEEERDILAVEKVLTGVRSSSSGREEVELEEGMILE